MSAQRIVIITTIIIVVMAIFGLGYVHSTCIDIIGPIYGARGVIVRMDVRFVRLRTKNSLAMYLKSLEEIVIFFKTVVGLGVLPVGRPLLVGDVPKQLLG